MTAINEATNQLDVALVRLEDALVAARAHDPAESLRVQLTQIRSDLATLRSEHENLNLEHTQLKAAKLAAEKKTQAVSNRLDLAIGQIRGILEA